MVSALLENIKPSTMGLLSILLRFTLCLLVYINNVYADMPSAANDRSASERAEDNSLVFKVAENTEGKVLAPYLQYQIENSSQVYPDEIIHDRAFNEGFKPIPSPDANFGFVTDAHWFKLSLQNTALTEGEQQNWYLELDYTFLDDVQAFIPLPDGKYDKQVVGDTHPFDVRDIKIPSYTFFLTLQGSEVHDVYFRIKSSTSVQMPVVLWSETGFIEQKAQTQYWLGAFYGVMLAMLLYNAFVYLSVRDKAYLLYIVYIATALLGSLIVTGVAFQQLWPEYPALSNYGFAIISPICMFFALQFTRSFLHLKEYGPRFDKFIQLSSGFNVLMLSFPYLFGLFFATALAVFVPIVVCLIIISAGMYGVVKGYRRAWFFTAAWGCLVTSFIIKALAQFEVLPVTFFTHYGMHIGTVAEVMLLSLALSDRINIEKAEKLDAVKDKLVALTKKQETRS